MGRRGGEKGTRDTTEREWGDPYSGRVCSHNSGIDRRNEVPVPEVCVGESL